MRTSHEGEPVKRILLLSDGDPNSGATTPSEFERIAEDLSEEGISVMAAGIGTEYNKEIIETIAINSQGQWDHITDAGDIRSFFNETVSATKTVTVSNPTLEIDLYENVELSEVFRRMPQVQALDRDWSGDAVSMQLPDLRDRQKQELVFRMDAPARDDGEYMLANIELDTGTESVNDRVVIKYTQDEVELDKEEGVPRAKFEDAKMTWEATSGDTVKADEGEVTKKVKDTIKTHDDEEAKTILQETEKQTERIEKEGTREAENDATKRVSDRDR